MTPWEPETVQPSSPDEAWQLILFVVRDDDRTRRVQVRLETLLQAHLPGPYRIETVNIMTNPEKGDDFDVIVTPTLIRVTPEPRIRLVGDLTLTEQVVARLGLEAR
jgi:circadian clock protein KaiB